MNYFNSMANLLSEYRELKSQMSNPNPGIVAISGLSRVHKAHFLNELAHFPKGSGSLLVLTENENEAMRLCEDIRTLGGDSVVYPAKDFNLISASTASSEYEHRRIAVLSNPPALIIATPEAACQTTFSQKELSERIISIEKDGEINTESLFARLVDGGYTRADMVEAISQFSVRGSVVDIWAVGAELPTRIDLWGDVVDSVSSFDVESQRRVEKLDKLFIAPSKEERNDSKPVGKKRLNGSVSTLFDFVHQIVICEQKACNVHVKAAYEQLKADIELALEAGERVGKLMISKAEYEAELERKCRAELCTFSGMRNRGGVAVNAVQVPPWNGDYSQLKADLRSYVKNGYAVIVFAGTGRSARSLALDLRDDGFKADFSESHGAVCHGHIYVVSGILSGGFDYPDVKCVCLTILGVGSAGSAVTGTAGEGYGGAPGKPGKKNKSQIIRAISDINVGDYVVHDNYGIGVFEGVTKLTNEGISKDYIKLRYAGKDALYVPVTQLDFIARYIGNTETANLKLSKLHTDTWFNTKTRVKKAVEELAQELIELYSRRMRSRGVAFSRDTPEQIEFESRFSYVETDDQLTCIEELKRDMQAEQPMDRLLCGDVGFGKTEVALRGAFKCVMDGYQCALLCPTTVLAWQHYQTAVARMNTAGDNTGHPAVNIELLSRFRTAKEKNEVLKKLESGVVDFVIGTHALVGKSVRFKNLGLVIIDEEQRFGVMQKEKLKQAFGLGAEDAAEDGETGVDVLTLSATPIPRTLNMAMSGIRDMSVIESPPHDRMPVTTYVIEHEYGVISAAIHKELRRAGQVYYVHNRVETIVSAAARLHELVPEARIGIAHGRMDERELLDVWRKLLEREIDVLVCTTLIETGVDVPNVNTLIIENADHMGLAQLHQLRGRVGRTNRRAYAYFTFSRGKVLSEIAEKRLKAIREFTQFGAGFKIALRDLEIRGAGSVLGESQSGHLSSVGYETYVRMLEQAVEEVRGSDSGTAGAAENYAGTGVQCTVDIKVDAFIPEGYISNQSQRIACYKKIAEIRDEDDAVDVTEELADRYGKIPAPVNGLVEAARIRNMAGALGISEIVQNREGLVFYWENPDMKRISRVSSDYAGRLALNLIGRTGLTLTVGKEDNVLEDLVGVLKSLDK
jgi:transcription-repair coupling factor (superfamily II helicase)